MVFVDDASKVISLMDELYDAAYKAGDKVDWYDRGMYAWDVLFYTHSQLIIDVARARGDAMTSDRECAAFGEAVTRIAYGL